MQQVEQGVGTVSHAIQKGHPLLVLVLVRIVPLTSSSSCSKRSRLLQQFTTTQAIQPQEQAQTIIGHLKGLGLFVAIVTVTVQSSVVAKLGPVLVETHQRVIVLHHDGKAVPSHVGNAPIASETEKLQGLVVLQSGRQGRHVRIIEPKIPQRNIQEQWTAQELLQ